MIPIEEKKNAKMSEEFRTISLTSHAAKLLLIALNRRIYGKLNATLEEEQFSFRKGKGTRDTIGLLRTIGERCVENTKSYMLFI